MAKILYIEDELTQNIASIRKFFSGVVSNRRFNRKLDELVNTERVYPEDVIEACSESSVLDVCHTFPMALDRIVNNHSIYDLIVIDRNLSLYDYSEEIEDIKSSLRSVGLNYDDDRLLSFYTREGDLLLLLLLKLNKEYNKRIYFLTANAHDELRHPHDLQSLLDIDSFKREHIIEKGSDKENIIHEILSNLPRFNIQVQFMEPINALREQDREYLVEQFIDSMMHFRRQDYDDFASNLRKLLHNMLEDIATVISNPNAANKADYWDNYNNLRISDFLIRDFGLPGYECKLGYNKVIRNFCYSTHHICSAFGSHDDSNPGHKRGREKKPYNLSKYSADALLNMICEIMIWYNKTMNILDE